MSTNRSRPAGAKQRRRPDRRRFLIAVLCALSCLGDRPRNLHLVSAQDNIAAPMADGAQAPVAEPTSTDASGVPAPAEVKKAFIPQKLDELLARKGSIQAKDGTLADWLNSIQLTWGVDIVYDNVALHNERVTGKFTDQPLNLILDTILSQKGYGYRRGEGDVLVIATREELGEAPPNQKKTLIPLQHIDPKEAMESIESLKSKNGKVTLIPTAKVLIVTDYPNNIEAIREHVDLLDKYALEAKEKELEEERKRKMLSAPPPTPGSNNGAQSFAPDVRPAEEQITTTFWPKFVQADSLLDAVTSQIAEGTATSVPELNAVVVTGSKSAVQAAAQIVKQLDVVKKQVRITVLMYDIDIEALEQLGVNWRNAGKGRIGANGFPRTFADLNSAPQNLGGSSGSSSSSSSSGSSSTSTTGASSSTTGSTSSTTTGAGIGSFVTSATPNVVGSVLTLTHLSRHFDLSAVFMALDQTDGARLLASPSVMCYDRKQTEMKIISEIPVQQLTQTDQGGNIGTTTFREAGVTLTVTPAIGDDGVVMLDVAPEFSVLTGFQAGQPIIDRRTHKGTIAVQSGDTLVMGGLRRRNEIETVSGIPGLMNLKYIGGLFRSHQTTLQESELITFIRTEVVDTCYPGYLREQVAAQIVDESLDRIPIAGHSPYTPPCNDPYCPIHNPRPKYWEGNMINPEPPPPGYSWSAPPPLQPRQYQPHYEMLPPVEGQAVEGENVEGGVQGPVAPPTRLAPPTPTAPRPPADVRGTLEATPDHETPPPVRIDENARRPNGNRMVLFRLPKVTPAPGSQGVREQPATNNDPQVARKPAVPQTSPAPAKTRTATAQPSKWQQLFR